MLVRTQITEPIDNNINLVYKCITAGKQDDEEVCKQMYGAHIITNGQFKSMDFVGD